MNPQSFISDLDAALADAGETITIRRYTGNGDPRPKIEETVPAAVRTVRPEQLIGQIDQTASNVVVSPTGLADFLPLKKGDKAVIQNRERNIEIAKATALQDRVVRIDLVVLG
ncbi:hypothetical protein [Hyphomicrobium sp. ghe19]|uniref:hypothetical protein n=1 Tax=Hyphomicrobium sp. ghe19 TaxID=2682968 RepID=UPI0013670CFD|nr:hypothetical protein HYPP_03771 [Hyphomicrobium sp. ghe19]